MNTSSGVAGFVFPGDRVDMVLTQQVQGGGGQLSGILMYIRFYSV